jgi:hypothetical protein
MGRWVATAVVLTLTARAVSAAPGKELSQAQIRSVPPALDPAYRHRGTNQLELGLYGGTYLGAHLKKSWIAGARALFHLSDWLAVGAAYGYSHHAVNLLDGPADPLHERNAHYVTGEVAFATAVAMRLGRSVIPMDLSTRLGIGARQLNGEWGTLGLIGGGVKFYTGLPWFAVRIDVNNYLHSVQLAPGRGSAFDVDVSFALGLAFSSRRVRRPSSDASAPASGML